MLGMPDLEVLSGRLFGSVTPKTLRCTGPAGRRPRGDGNHTCSIADFSGTMKGPMKTGDGKVIPPTGKSFHVEFCTVATWNEKGEITEERLFYDLVGLMRQTGLA